MKKLKLLTALIFAVSFIFLGCIDDAPTELAFKNSPSSDGPINDIVWVEDDIHWIKGTIGIDGYDKSEITKSKEVHELTSSVECTVDPDGLGFVVADVDFGSGSSSLSLEEGTSYVFTLIATH